MAYCYFIHREVEELEDELRAVCSRCGREWLLEAVDEKEGE
jgi:hypothetical protein